MASDSDAKYKGAFWKFIAGVMFIAFVMLSIAFCIACHIIMTGGPTLDEVQKAHEEQLKAEGYLAHIVKNDAPSMETTLYDLLGVARDADASEIDASYLAHANASYRDYPNGSEAFVRLAEAHQTLSDKRLRMDYDHDLNDGTIGKKHEARLSMDEAKQIYQAVQQRRRQSTMFGNLNHDLDSDTDTDIDDDDDDDNEDDNPHVVESHAHIPSFPLVKQLVRMMGGPRIRLFRIPTRHRIQISKICVNGLCRITIANQTIQGPPEEVQIDGNDARLIGEDDANADEQDNANESE